MLAEFERMTNSGEHSEVTGFNPPDEVLTAFQAPFKPQYVDPLSSFRSRDQSIDLSLLNSKQDIEERIKETRSKFNRDRAALVTHSRELRELQTLLDQANASHGHLDQSKINQPISTQFYSLSSYDENEDESGQPLSSQIPSPVLSPAPSSSAFSSPGTPLFQTTVDSWNRIRDQTRIENKLGIKEEGNSSTMFCDSSYTIVADGYQRLLFGDHGPYVEFTIEQIRWTAFITSTLKCEHAYYDEHYTHVKLKAYQQKRHVREKPNPPKGPWSVNHDRPEGYADYKVGMIYISADKIGLHGHLLACITNRHDMSEDDDSAIDSSINSLPPHDETTSTPQYTQCCTNIT